MKGFRLISCLSFAYILSILSIHGVDINILSDRVHNETNDLAARLIFKEFVIAHNRTYVDDPGEYSRRLATFKESLSRHAKLNARERELNGTAVYGVNQFSDWTTQEFREFLRRGSRGGGGVLANSIEIYQTPICKFCDLNLNTSDTPHSQDWTKKGKVTAVKNQGKCGSCWAFTATECVETQWAIAGNTLTELSVQEFISCSRKKGCSGGDTFQALSWLQGMNYTLVRASEFPYVDKETDCKTNLLEEPGVRIKCGCLLNMINKTELTDMKTYIGLHGPLGVNVDATMWHDYLGGIIQHHCTDTDINHAVQITGYDFNGHIWYWIVRNSWGSSFGENGYLYIKMGDNLCGVAYRPSYVVV